MEIFDNGQSKWLLAAVGAVVGFLVSLTSIGSGSLMMASLVVLYQGIPMKRIAGSDIFHALILVGISALGHLGLRSVDVPTRGAPGGIYSWGPDWKQDEYGRSREGFGTVVGNNSFLAWIQAVVSWSMLFLIVEPPMFSL